MSATTTTRRGPMRQARAEQVFRRLVHFGGGEAIEFFRDELPDLTRTEFRQAIDDLVEDGRAVLEVGAYGYYVTAHPVITDDDVAALGLDEVTS